MTTHRFSILGDKIFVSPIERETYCRRVAKEGIVNLTRFWQTGVMKIQTPSYQRHRFPSEIISHAVWLYHRFCLSFREVEELLAERGITVTYETVRQWCRKFGPAYARKLKKTTRTLGITEPHTRRCEALLFQRYCQFNSGLADWAA